MEDHRCRTAILPQVAVRLYPKPISRTKNCQPVGMCFHPVYSPTRLLVTDMTLLNNESVIAFLGRFDSFNDAILRTIEISYAKGGSRRICIYVGTRDTSVPENEGWVTVCLIIDQVSDFCFADVAKETIAVLSAGIHISWFGPLVGIDLGHFVDPPESVEELKTSRVFVTGASIGWTTGPY